MLPWERRTRMTGYVIAIASSKGGVGKTTLALTLGGEFVERGARVALIDADPNKPLVQFAADAADLPENLTVVGDTGEGDITDRILEIREQHDLTIVDLEGTASLMVGMAIGLADLVLVPMRLSNLDAAESTKVLKMIRQQQKVLGRPIAHALVASCTKAAIVSKNERFISEAYYDAGVRFLRAEFVERDAFKAQFSLLKLLRQMERGDAPNLGRACVNAGALAKEVYELLTADVAANDQFAAGAG